MDEASCKAAMTDSVNEANAGADMEAAKGTPGPALDGYLQGFTVGKVFGGMIKRTQGKFYGCFTKS